MWAGGQTFGGAGGAMAPKSTGFGVIGGKRYWGIRCRWNHASAKEEAAG